MILVITLNFLVNMAFVLYQALKGLRLSFLKIRYKVVVYFRSRKTAARASFYESQRITLIPAVLKPLEIGTQRIMP